MCWNHFIWLHAVSWSAYFFFLGKKRRKFLQLNVKVCSLLFSIILVGVILRVIYWMSHLVRHSFRSSAAGTRISFMLNQSTHAKAGVPCKWTTPFFIRRHVWQVQLLNTVWSVLNPVSGERGGKPSWSLLKKMSGKSPYTWRKKSPDQQKSEVLLQNVWLAWETTCPNAQAPW